jgi:SGNH domain (fused to AT3 domains)
VHRLALLVVAAATLAIAVSAPASRYQLHLPKPGSASEVTSLVAASSSITQLPTHLFPPLRAVGADAAAHFYPAAKYSCTTVTQCVFGDTSSKRTVVLFGDSHAHMWLPAIAPDALAAKMRLVLLWKPGCPADDVSVWFVNLEMVDKSCNAFRAKSIADIQHLHPAVVLMASRTSDVPVAGNTLDVDATWTSAAEATINALQSSTTKVAIIQDITIFNSELPHCLRVNSTAVQRCSAPSPNPRTRPRFTDEQAAAASTGALYVLTQKWLCTSVCSPVIGKMVAYFNNEHISATYSEFLSRVLGKELAPLFEAS